MMLKLTRILLALISMSSAISYAMVFDNRYLPLLQRPFITVPTNPSHLAMDVFFTTGDAAFREGDVEMGIPELYGPYQQNVVAAGLTQVGFTNPLPPQFQTVCIPWSVREKIQTQGFAVAAQIALTKQLQFGLFWGCIRSNASLNYLLEDIQGVTVQPSDIALLDRIRRQMNNMSCLAGDHALQTSMLDLDLYARYLWSWDYVLKMRHIDFALRIGGLFPAADRRMIDNPASIPLGGDGFYGIYGSIDGEFELKEDWKAGYLFRLQKRFGRTLEQRMPVNSEPMPYGAVVGPAHVNPGLTFVFSPYASFENLRHGLGMRVIYTLIRHGHDTWSDRRPCPIPAVDLEPLKEFTSWASEYITLNVFYDFGKDRESREFMPIFFFAWDIPSRMLVARKVAKTDKVSIGFEFNF